MYSPTFRIKSNGVPILSKIEIEQIAERCLLDFCPEALITPQPIDEDRFLTEYLGLTQDFQYLSHCGLYLGMMIFEDSDKIIVYNEEENKADYISAKKGTVIIDSTLLEENQEHRYRFTAIHEGAHWILHKHKFCKTIGQPSLFELYNVRNFQCRANNIECKFKPLQYWNDDDTMEWQANYFTSALLMPKNMIFKVCNDKETIDEIKFRCFGYDEFYNEFLIMKISETFKISKKAVEIRLMNLNIIRSDNKINII